MARKAINKEATERQLLHQRAVDARELVANTRAALRGRVKQIALGCPEGIRVGLNDFRTRFQTRVSPLCEGMPG